MDSTLKQANHGSLTYTDMKVSVEMKKDSYTDAMIRLRKVLPFSPLSGEPINLLSFYIREHAGDDKKEREDEKKKQWLKELVKFFEQEKHESYDVKVSTFQNRALKLAGTSLIKLVESHYVKFSLSDVKFYEGYDRFEIFLFAYKPENPRGFYFTVFVNIAPHKSYAEEQKEAPVLGGERRK